MCGPNARGNSRGARRSERAARSDDRVRLSYTAGIGQAGALQAEGVVASRMSHPAIVANSLFGTDDLSAQDRAPAVEAQFKRAISK